MLGVETRVQRFAKYHKVLTRQRHVTFHAPWRLFVIVMAGLILYYAWSTLQTKYAITVLPPGVPETIGELLFKWFFYGMIIGSMVFAFLLEGEYLLGIWRLAKSVEREVERDAERLLGKKRR